MSPELRLLCYKREFSEFHIEFLFVEGSSVEDLVEVVLFHGVRVVDQLRHLENQSLHVILDLPGKSGAVIAKGSFGNYRVLSQVGNNGLFDPLIVALSRGDQVEVRAHDLGERPT